MRIDRVVAPVRTQVEDALRREILEGELVSGQRLVERELCEKLSVSRPLVREALRQLQAEKLVTQEPQGGIRVAIIGEAEASQLYDVRSLLEPPAASLFVTNASNAQHQALAKTLETIEEAIQAGQVALAIKAKNQFYQIIVSGSGHAVLEQTLTGLQNRIQLLRGISMSEPGRLEHTALEIRKIAHAISQGDPQLAHDACSDHLRVARQTTLIAVRNRELKRKLAEVE